MRRTRQGTDYIQRHKFNVLILKISFPIAKRGKNYTRALLIRHGFAVPPSPLGKAFLVALLTLT